MSSELEVQMGIDINNLMSTRDKLQKELTDARALIAWQKRREELLRKQFAFYVEYNQPVDTTQEFPKLWMWLKDTGQ